MSIFDKLFGKHKEEPEKTAAVSAPETEDPESEPEDDIGQVSEEEEKMLALLETLELTSIEDKSSSFTVMRFYRFSSPFSDEAIVNIVKGIRWIGMRFYGFTVTEAGVETACPNWVSLLRSVAEGSVDAVTLTGTFGGVKVTSVINREGFVTFCHDITRDVDLTPFTQLFEPEEV